MMFKMKEKVGLHFQDGREYKAEDLVETDLELDKMFPAKFEKIKEIKVVEEARPETFEEAAEVPEAPTPVKRKGKRTSKDVTSLFPDASKKDIQVFIRDGEFVAVDADKPDVVLTVVDSSAAMEEWLKGQ